VKKLTEIENNGDVSMNEHPKVQEGSVCFVHTTCKQCEHFTVTKKEC